MDETQLSKEGQQMTPEQEKLLEPWSELYARLYERLDRMPDNDLQELREASEANTTTNCWCMTYAVSKIIAREAASMLAHRRVVSNQAK